ncbi:hypothetical protein ACVXHA_15230 [Escherichia coli]
MTESLPLLAQALMQTGLPPAGVTPEIITLSGGVGECYRHQPADRSVSPILAHFWQWRRMTIRACAR